MSLAASEQIWILAESNGAYWSWYELTSIMCLNQASPSYFDNSNKVDFSKSLLSVMLNYERQADFLHFFRIHIPALNSLPDLYI